MRYAITDFRKEIPSIPGMKMMVSLDGVQIMSFTDVAWSAFPEGIYREEIPELEGSEAWKFYSDVRGYRKAYSDVEGLIPDADELAKGSRKTKIYITDEINAATVSLMKKIMKYNIKKEFDKRGNRDYESEIMAHVDSLQTIRDINYEREKLLGTEMPKKQLQELFLWDDSTNSRKGQNQYTLGF